MMKKYCEYCGERNLESKSSVSRESRTRIASSLEDDRELDEFLHHFASTLDDEDELDENDFEDDEDDLEATMGHVSSETKMEKIASITRKLDSVATLLEESGKRKIAFELDKISDLLDTYRQGKGV